MSRSKKTFYKCGKCGKTLIERRPSGMWYFIFGRNKKFIPVEMHIHGNVKMRCLRRSCRKANPTYWNIFNFFPQPMETIDDLVESLPANIDSNTKGGED